MLVIGHQFGTSTILVTDQWSCWWLVRYQVFPRVSSSWFAPGKLTVPRPWSAPSTFSLLFGDQLFNSKSASYLSILPLAACLLPQPPAHQVGFCIPGGEDVCWNICWMFVEIFVQRFLSAKCWAVIPQCKISPCWSVMASRGAKSFKEQFLPRRNTLRWKDEIKWEFNEFHPVCQGHWQIWLRIQQI